MKITLIAVLLAGFLWSGPAYGHHGAAAFYDVSKSITVEGVVTEFRLINPHARIYFDVKKPDGTVEKWLAEGNAAGILRRNGFTNDTLKPGDVIKVTGSPERSGKPMLDWTSIALSNGTVLYGGNTQSAERARQLNEIEKRRQQTKKP